MVVYGTTFKSSRWPPIIERHVWLTNLQYDVDDLFFTFFSLFLDFHTRPSKILKHPFNLFMFKIWSIFFLLPFVLFKKNYFFFILIPFQFFHLSYVYLFFWLLFVIFEIILIFFFYNFTHFRFFFLSVSIFDPLIFFRFVFHGVILTSGFESRAWKVHLVWLDFFFTINFFSILSFNTRFVGDEASLFFLFFLSIGLSRYIYHM
jgi:hypothetical protein